MTDKKEKAPKARGDSIITLLLPYKKALAILLFLAIAGNVLSLLLPRILGIVIDSIGKHDIVVKKYLLWFLAISVLAFLFGYIQSLHQVHVSEKVAKDLRNRLAAKIAQSDFSYVESENPAKLLTNFTTDVDGIKNFVAQALVSIVSSIIGILGTATLLFTINWKLAILVVAITSTIGVSFYKVLSKVRSKFGKSREAIDSLNKIINESIWGAFLIRVLNAQHAEYEKFIRMSTNSKDIGLSILRLFAWLIPIITFTANFAALTILVYGGHLTITHDMSLGDLAAFNSYLALLIFPIIIIGFMSTVIVQATVSYGRISSVLNYENPKHSGLQEMALAGDISMVNVNLDHGARQVLKNINIHIRHNTRVAIVGPTAAGKTQLLYLLAGLLKPTSGDIFIGGTPPC